jgi:tetratricopeptide (TPR) repeat protein
VLWELRSEANLHQAEILQREALSLSRSALSVDDAELIECQSELGSLLADRGKLAEADVLLCEALAVYHRRPDRAAGDVTNTLVRVARLRETQGRHGEAEQAARDALCRRQRMYPDSDHRVAKAKSLLGLTLIGLGKFDEAESLLLAAYDALQERGALGAGPPRLVDTIARIVLLYQSWNKPKSAEKWLAFGDKSGSASAPSNM